MYDNIGEKIKGLAKSIFIVEAISAIITGTVLLANEFILAGFLTLFCGPIVAWVSSWILYAFGELVDKSCDNERNTRQILEKLNTKPTKKASDPAVNESKTARYANLVAPIKEDDIPEKKKWSDTAPFTTTEKGTIICSQCKFEQPGDRKICWRCGTKFMIIPQATKKVSHEFKSGDPNAPYWCGNCGHDGPYAGNCPECNSSMKKYNINK